MTRVAVLIGTSSMMVLSLTAAVATNGAAFFRPAGKHAKVDLVYFGNIRDEHGRRLNYADVTVYVNNLSMTFPFSNETLGRYRSPDIGALVKEAGGEIVASQVEITCYVPGYARATMSVPMRTKGIYEVSFELNRDPEQTLDYELEGTPRSTRTPALGLLCLLVTGAVAHTASRRRVRAGSGRGPG